MRRYKLLSPAILARLALCTGRGTDAGAVSPFQTLTARISPCRASVKARGALCAETVSPEGHGSYRACRTHGGR